MTLMDTTQLLSNFGEFVGAIAVVATLGSADSAEYAPDGGEHCIPRGNNVSVANVADH